jgi:superfamily II DNA helicase RecQ
LIKLYPIKSLIVIANPKTIVNKLKCPKAIQNNICKYDQIAVFLKKELNDKKNELHVLEKHIYSIAEFLIKNNKPITFDYISKYSLTDEDFIKIEQPIKPQLLHKIEETVICEAPIESKISVASQNQSESLIYLALKDYRLKVSKAEGIKAYMVYSNQEMDLLIEKNPKSKAELLQVKGFGEKKIEKYGENILNIFNTVNNKL